MESPNSMALHSMAIKINVAPKEQEALYHALEAIGYKGQRRKLHCTVGFIEQMIPPAEIAAFGKVIIDELQGIIDQEPLLYEVDKVASLFGRVIGFLPTPSSQRHLKKINLWLFHRIEEMSQGRWGLNRESIPENYIPHLTLWHSHRPDHRFIKLEGIAETHPTYHLTNAACVIVN